MQAKKSSNESDDSFLRRFNTLKTQIGDEANNPSKIEVMLFFARLDELMQQENHEQSSMPETKHDLVAIAKKLQHNLDLESKPPLPTVLVLHLPLRFNLSEVMILLPALRMRTAVDKRSFAPIVKEKATQKRNVKRNLAMLSIAERPGSIQLEHRLL